MNSPQFVVLVPARLKSTRLPDKALADIGGKPMVVRVVEQARQSLASRIIVATDHPDIAAACAAHGVESLMTAAHHQSGTDRLAEAANQLQLTDETIVVNVQGDEPFIDPELINIVAQRLAADSNLPMATACHPIHSKSLLFNPNVVKVVLDQQGRARYFSRAPIPYARDQFATEDQTDALPNDLPAFRHIGIYAYRAGFLRTYQALTPCALESQEALEQLRVLWHGHEIGVSVVNQAPEAGVDTPEDLARVQARWHEINA